MNKKKCFVAWILICSMLVFYIPGMASDGSEESRAADTKVDVQITLEYRQEQARTILNMVNEFRTGDNAWFWNSDNETKTTYQPNELSALTYDYTLEEIAMQRAAEIALHYDHTRPNGESCFTAFTQSGYPGTASGENIAVGYRTPEAVFIGWREDDDYYVDQGHRRNMLNASMTAIGIGYVYYNGTAYWTMELGNAVTQKTDSVTDGTAEARITILSSYIESLSTDEQTYTVACNDKIDVPKVHTQMTTKKTWPAGKKVSGTIIEPEWTVADTAVAEISNGKITGKKVGTTVLTAKAGAESVQVTLSVTGLVLTDTNVVLPDETFVYSGSELKPEPTVTYDGTVLEKGKDYKVSYKNNIEAGINAQVIVQGIGNYSGEIVKNFTISACAHEWGTGEVTKAAACEEAGVRTFTCANCGETKTESIPATDHNWGTGEVTKAATCEEAGVKTFTCANCNKTKTEEIPATDHNWGAGEITKEPACEEAGVKTFTCANCNKTKTEEIPATDHNWDAGKITKAATCEEAGVKTFTCANCNKTKTEEIPATCEEAGVKTFTCANCNKTKTEEIPATDHNWDAGEVTKAATCEEAGVKTFICANCAKTKTEPIPATGHNWDAGKVTKAATCEEAGVKTFTCANCNKTKTEEIPAMGHSYGEPVFTWTEDYSFATADFSCTVCENINTISASVTIETNKNITSYTAEAVFNEKVYKENKRIISLNEGSRLIVSDEIVEIPETLKYSTKEEIINAFVEEIKKKDGYSSKNMTVYDVQFQISINGKWEKATKENFPKEGLTMTIPYPEGTDGSKYDFVVTHMITYDINSFKAGDIETLDVTKTEEGLQFTVMSLSPITIAWKEIAVEKETTTLNKETTVSNDNEKNTSDNKETTTAKNNTTTDSIKTGDNTSVILWVILGLSAACGCLITGWRKQKKHSA